jgi:hypothetical protein
MRRRSHHRRRLFPKTGIPWSLVLFISTVLSLSGCVSWQTADGTQHTLVLGFGLISTKNGPDQSATAYRCQTLGLAVRTGGPNNGLVIGSQNLQQTQIAPDWQGIVQVSATPGQPLIVEGHAPQPANTTAATNPHPEEWMP